MIGRGVEHPDSPLPFDGQTCQRCGMATLPATYDCPGRRIEIEGAPADFENGPSENEIPIILCHACDLATGEVGDWTEDLESPPDLPEKPVVFIDYYDGEVDHRVVRGEVEVITLDWWHMKGEDGIHELVESCDSFLGALDKLEAAGLPGTLEMRHRVYEAMESYQGNYVGQREWETLREDWLFKHQDIKGGV